MPCQEWTWHSSVHNCDNWLSRHDQCSKDHVCVRCPGLWPCEALNSYGIDTLISIYRRTEIALTSFKVYKCTNCWFCIKSLISFNSIIFVFLLSSFFLGAISICSMTSQNKKQVVVAVRRDFDLLLRSLSYFIQRILQVLDLFTFSWIRFRRFLSSSYQSWSINWGDIISKQESILLFFWTDAKLVEYQVLLNSAVNTWK